MRHLGPVSKKYKKQSHASTKIPLCVFLRTFRNKFTSIPSIHLIPSLFSISGPSRIKGRIAQRIPNPSTDNDSQPVPYGSSERYPSRQRKVRTRCIKRLRQTDRSKSLASRSTTRWTPTTKSKRKNQSSYIPRAFVSRPASLPL